jgi:major type 1 subunit fimbrin (pilin)
MKKLLAITALASLCAMAGSQAAEKGTVSFDGMVTGSTCDVTVNDGTADGTVTLPTVTAADLNQSKTAGKTTFNFTFTHCAGSFAHVRPYFETGSTVDSTNYYLKNAGGDATGVELVLKTPGGNQIQPGTDTQAGGVAWSSGSVTSGDFSVEYITNDLIGPATGGTVKSSVIYHLDYY